METAVDQGPARRGAAPLLDTAGRSRCRHATGHFLFAERFRHKFGEWIVERFGDAPERDGRTGKLGRDGLRALESILARPVQLRISLGGLLSDDDEELQVLTQGQFHILRGIEGMSRAAISGGAGTGKTVLAMEEAGRWADRGARVLFLCYNRGLAREIRERLRGRPSVSAVTFHQLCTGLTGQAGIECPGNVPEQQRFDEVYPELLMQAFERLPDQRHDVIIVDEGQDFRPLWWTAIEAGLDPDGRKLVRIFHDSNQRVYGNVSWIPDDVTPVSIRLTLNLRNTRRIHTVVSRHYEGHEIEPTGPEGVEVRWIVTDSQRNMRRCISECVRRLTVVEGVAEADIAVLAPTESDMDGILQDNRLGRLSVTRCDRNPAGRIVVDTIRRFKGLERPVVVRCGNPGDFFSAGTAVCGAFRGRTHLVVAGEQTVLDRLRTRQRNDAGDAAFG